MGRDQPQETASVSTAGDAEPAVDCQQRPQIRVTGQSVLDASNWKHVLLANTTPIAASSAAVAGVLAGFPFDSIKTRMQTHHYDSIIDCVRKTYASEGLSGYFRGIIPPLITVSIIKSFAFSVYEGTKLHLKHTFPAAQSDAKSRKWQLDLSGNSIASNTLLCTLSGATSGAFVAVFSCPLELVKVQRQLALVIANQQMQKYQHLVQQQHLAEKASRGSPQHRHAAIHNHFINDWQRMTTPSGNTLRGAAFGDAVKELSKATTAYAMGSRVPSASTNINGVNGNNNNNNNNNVGSNSTNGNNGANHAKSTSHIQSQHSHSHSHSHSQQSNQRQQQHQQHSHQHHSHQHQNQHQHQHSHSHSHSHSHGQQQQLLEDIKRRKMIARSSWLSAREVLRAKGIMGLYSGFSCHFARDTLGTAVYFGTYEFVKRSIATRSEGDGSQLYKTGPMVHFLAGGMCGVISWLIIFPTDLVKSILQKDVLSPNPGYRGVIDCVRRVYATNGLRGMYRGISVTLIRAFPLHSLNFVVYEGVRDYISKIASN